MSVTRDDHPPPPHTLPPTRSQPAPFLAFREGLGAARPCCRLLSGSKAQLRDLEQMSELTGGWESSDLHQGADQQPLPPLPLTRSPKEARASGHPLSLPQAELSRRGGWNQQRWPEDQEESLH